MCSCGTRMEPVLWLPQELRVGLDCLDAGWGVQKFEPHVGDWVPGGGWAVAGHLSGAEGGASGVVSPPSFDAFPSLSPLAALLWVVGAPWPRTVLESALPGAVCRGLLRTEPPSPAFLGPSGEQHLGMLSVQGSPTRGHDL